MSDNLSIDLIRPRFAEASEEIEAWFTQKNANKINTGGLIRGLNVGLNTGEDRDRVQANRQLLFSSLHIDPDWVAMGKQVHSNRVQHVSTGGLFDNTDGLVTNIPGLALAIQVADCAAVLLADPANSVVAALHAGWRGAVGDIVPRGIELMGRYGAVPGEMVAFVSPCISQKNFEVGEEVAELFPDLFVDRNSYAKPHVDLKGFLKWQLREAGLSDEKIEVHNGCTIEEAQRFYSYRREQQKSGRMFGMIQLTSRS